MKSYDKTTWINNRTVVDAEHLNNIEDQIAELTKATIDLEKRLTIIENTFPMKANMYHEHEELNLIVKEVEKLKEGIDKEFSEQLGYCAEKNNLHICNNDSNNANEDIKLISPNGTMWKVVIGDSGELEINQLQ